MSKLKPIVICGATASGKSALALQLAQKFGSVIINADSQQVYRELPILSAQPSAEEMKLAPHKLYGFISGAEKFDVAEWLRLASGVLQQYVTSHTPAPIIVGGTGLYFNALFYGLSPIPNIPEEIRLKVRSMSDDDVKLKMEDKWDGNPQRMKRALEVKLATGKDISDWHQTPAPHPYTPQDFTILNLNVSRETIYDNINRRFLNMLEFGAVEEVKHLLSKNLLSDLPVMKAVGVREISDWLAGIVSRETAVEIASQKSRNYAKRQMTWFRNSMPDSKIDVANLDDAIRVIKR